MKNVAIALHVKLDDLVFRPGERGPFDQQLRLQLKAISKMPHSEKKVFHAILDGMIVKHRAETVCVAAISQDGREMLRLFPIRYRQLPKDRQFDRFDLVELTMELPRDDHRPESRHVLEDSIRIVGRGREINDAAKVRL